MKAIAYKLLASTRILYSTRVNSKEFLPESMLLSISLSIAVFSFFIKVFFDNEKVVDVPLVLSMCLFLLKYFNKREILMNMKLDSRKDIVLIAVKD